MLDWTERDCLALADALYWAPSYDDRYIFPFFSLLIFSLDFLDLLNVKLFMTSFIPLSLVYLCVCIYAVLYIITSILYTSILGRVRFSWISWQTWCSWKRCKPWFCLSSYSYIQTTDIHPWQIWWVTFCTNESVVWNVLGPERTGWCSWAWRSKRHQGTPQNTLFTRLESIWRGSIM